MPRQPSPGLEVVNYHAPSAASASAETLTLGELRSRAGAAELGAPQRLQFLLLVLYTRGRGEHLVDFVAHPVRAGTLIVVPPGSVHQFRLQPSMDARLLLAQPAAMLPLRTLATLAELPDSTEWPHCTQLAAPDARDFVAACELLAVDARRRAPAALLRALALQRFYACLLLLQIAWHGAAGSGGPGTTAAGLTLEFRRLIEHHFAQRWPALRYAKKLGYAEKTLARACLAANGLSPKAWIDARVLLEAKRLLAHGDDSVQAIALRLGFESSSQLVRFFRRLEGDTPLAFRHMVRR